MLKKYVWYSFFTPEDKFEHLNTVYKRIQTLSGNTGSKLDNKFFGIIDSPDKNILRKF